MSIEYKVIPRKVLGGEDKGKEKYYASTSARGEVTLDDLTKEIEKSSTVSGTDIRAVLYALVDALPDHLADGNIVRLGDLGSFRITINSNGEDAEKDVSEKSIKKSRILFSPGRKFLTMFKTLSFVKKQG